MEKIDITLARPGHRAKAKALIQLPISLLPPQDIQRLFALSVLTIAVK
jgi:hypothetical protein